MNRDTINAVVDFVTTHNRVTLLAMLLLTGIVAAGIPMLDTTSQASPNSESFQDLQQVEKSQYVQQSYSYGNEQDTTIAQVYIHREDGDVLSKDSLLDGLRYQQAVRDNPSLEASLKGDGIVGLSNLVARRAADADNPGLQDQIEALEAASNAEVEELIAQTIAKDPRAKQFLPADHDPQSTNSEDRRIRIELDSQVSESKLTAATAALNHAANERSQEGFFTLNEHAFDDFTSHLVKELVQLVVPIALLLILVVLGFSYRDVVDVVAGMIGVGLSILWMFGIMGWFGVAAGVVSIVPVVLITGLSVDFSFHVFNRYREERAEGEGIREPMNRGVRYVVTALVLVTVTAAIGFLSNLANPLALIRTLGISITLGVVSSLLVFITVVPALKISIDERLEQVGLDRRKQALGQGRFLEPVLAGSLTLAKRAAPFVVVIAIIGATISGMAWTTLDQEQFTGREGEVAEWKQDLPDPIGWEPHEYQSRSDHVKKTYHPIGAGDTLRSPLLVEGSITNPETLERVHEGVQRITQSGILLQSTGETPVKSPVTAMQAVAQRDDRFARTFRESDTDGNGIPDSNLATLYDAFYAADPNTAEQVLDRRDGEYRSLLVLVTLDSTDQSDQAAYVEELRAGANRMDKGNDLTVTVTGELAVTQSILNRLQTGILLTMIIALAAVAGTMALVFRVMHGSATLGIVVALPIVLVVGFVIGSMSLLGIPLNLLTALLMSMVIGLGIDYNIHMGDRFADELLAGEPFYDALRTAVTGTGGALLGSTLTSAGAFTTLLIVPDPGLQAFGAIVVVALSTAFLTCVFVLPCALVLWRRAVSSDLLPIIGIPENIREEPEKKGAQD